MSQYELSKFQRKIYEFHKLYKNDPSYNLTLCFKITGNFDLRRFCSISDMCISNSDILKATILETNKVPYHCVDNSRTYKCELINCDEKFFEDFYKRVTYETNLYINVPIVLSEWPLLHIKIFTHIQYGCYLVIAIPHIIFDVYSCYLLFNDISKYYNSEMSINEIQNAISSANYHGFFESIEAHKDEDKNQDKAAAFFKKELDGIKNFDIMQIKENRDSEGLLRGKYISFFLGSKRYHLIQNLVKQKKLSEFSMFLAIYGVFLNKVLGEQKIVTGIPLANRKSPNVVGYFINTLPAVLDMQDGKTFSELWFELAVKTYELLRYDDFDLADLNCTDISGMINNVFTYHKQSISPHFKGCEVTPIKLNKTTLSFNLSGVVEKLNDDYLVEIGCGKYFDEIEIDKIFECITDQILDNSDIKIKDIKIIDDGEVIKTYQYVNHYKPLIKADTAVNRFERMVAAYGNRIALDYNDDEWTYKKLNQVSNQIARFLSDRFSCTSKIAISLNRNNYLVATILGTLKAGKTYVPIDLMSPPKRINYILNDLGSVSIVGEKQIIDNLTVPDNQKVTIDEVLECISKLDQNNIDIKPTETDGAYIIYTSGSTGDPKGVMVNHRNMMSIIDCATKQFNFTKNDIWTLFHSYGFDFSVWEIFGCLLNGAKLIVIDNLLCKSPRDYYSLVSQKKVTILNHTPTSFIEFMNIDTIENRKINLRYVFLGGETIYANSLGPWIVKHKSDAKLVNLYGITETSIASTYYEFSANDLGNGDKNIIGSCFANQGIYIVDKNLKILPKGVAGEIIIYGDSVTDGYYNNPELTAKKFVKLSGISKDYTFYRSGDLALINSRNQIEYLGRIDKQIKLRGYRIELGEIENAILKATKVKACVVEMVSFSSQDEQLVAYVVTFSDAFDQTTVKEKLRKTLPPYMIPAMFIAVESIPMTINGKVDFVSLRENIKSDAIVSGVETETERKLSNIIIEVARTGNFSTNDNFFDIGINSLHLPNIYNKIKQTFSIDDFEMVDLFQYTTIQTLAKLIDSKVKSSNLLENLSSIDRGSLRKNVISKKRKGEF